MSSSTPRLFPIAVHVGAIVVLTLMIPRSASLQVPTCDMDLPSSPKHPYGYRLRGDRCEGVYIQEVALANLLVASFTESYEDFDPGQGQDLQLDWTVPRAAEVKIRAHGIGQRLYFRMDTTRAAGVTSYRWPTGLLAGLRIDKRKLGIVAWTEEKLAGVARRVYLPLRVRQRQGPVRSSQYTLLLVPGRELQEVYTHLAGVRDDGTSMPATDSRKALGRGYYPPGVAIPIELSGLTTPGNYSVEIGTVLTGGENLTTTVGFYYAGR